MALMNGKTWWSLFRVFLHTPRVLDSQNCTCNSPVIQPPGKVQWQITGEVNRLPKKH